MGKWNYRVLAFPDGKYMYFEVNEVYYDKELKPNGYKNAKVSGGDMSEMKDDIERMRQAMKKPILWGGDKFPQEYT